MEKKFYVLIDTDEGNTLIFELTEDQAKLMRFLVEEGFLYGGYGVLKEVSSSSKVF